MLDGHPDRDRPPRTGPPWPEREDLAGIFIAAAFPVHVWAIVQFLYAFPGYTYYLEPGEILSILGHVLVFAFFESAVVFVVICVLVLLLPARFIRDDWPAKAILVVFPGVLWLVPFHYLHLFKFSSLFQLQMAAFGWIFSLVVTLLVLFRLANHNQRFVRGLRALLDRIALLTWLYVGLDGVALAFLVYRNIALSRP